MLLYNKTQRTSIFLRFAFWFGSLVKLPFLFVNIQKMVILFGLLMIHCLQMQVFLAKFLLQLMRITISIYQEDL